MEKLDAIIAKHKQGQVSVIGILQDILEAYRYLPEEAIERVSKEFNIPMSRLFGLATFYKKFRLEPVGEHVVCVCLGTACHVNGGERLVDFLHDELKVTSGQTTADGKFTLETVSCLGACALGPLVVIDGEYHGHMDRTKLRKVIDQYAKKSGAAA